MMMPEHPSLRPEFTQSLASMLLSGRSVNLISPHGQGRRRTLEDLRATLPPSLPVLQGNLRNYPDSVEQLACDLASQCGAADSNELEHLFAHLEQQHPLTLITFHNFDALHQSKTSGFDANFFDLLNSIEQRPQLSLLTVSESSTNQSLKSRPLLLPALTSEQLASELKRQLPKLSADEMMQLANILEPDPAPYTALLSLVSETVESP